VVFLLGRTWLRAWAQRRLAAVPKLQAVERAVSREGLKLVLLTRLSPAFPFSLLNLAYGLSEVSLLDYTLGLIGILPGTILFCGLGALAGDVARFGEVLSGEADPATWALRMTGILATVAVVWLVSRAARQALQESEPQKSRRPAAPGSHHHHHRHGQEATVQSWQPSDVQRSISSIDQAAIRRDHRQRRKSRARCQPKTRRCHQLAHVAQRVSENQDHHRDSSAQGAKFAGSPRPTSCQYDRPERPSDHPRHQ